VVVVVGYPEVTGAGNGGPKPRVIDLTNAPQIVSDSKLALILTLNDHHNAELILNLARGLDFEPNVENFNNNGQHANGLAIGAYTPQYLRKRGLLQGFFIMYQGRHDLSQMI